MKDSKYYKKLKLKESNENRIWVSKMLIAIIIVLSCLIVTNFDSDIKNMFKKEILEENISFGNIREIYKKYIGRDSESTELVSNTNANINEYEEVDGSYKIMVEDGEGIEVLEPGIIVFVGEKDDFGNTVIVQGNNGVDIWYSNVELNEYSLYDYVSRGDILGNSISDNYLVTIMKDGEKLKYEEYF